MNEILKSHSPKKHARSFKYAFSGIFHALLNEANFRVQVVIVAAALVLGFYFNISHTDWGLLIIAVGAMLSAELLNTLVENVIDKLFPDYDDAVKVIKDVSAGFVLISSLTALAVLVLIFGSYFLDFYNSL